MTQSTSHYPNPIVELNQWLASKIPNARPGDTLSQRGGREISKATGGQVTPGGGSDLVHFVLGAGTTLAATRGRVSPIAVLLGGLAGVVVVPLIAEL